MSKRSTGARRRWLSGLVAVAVAGVGLPLFAAQAALADSAPTPPTPRTVTADSLPTVQINGVVWDQVVVGNRVYATGSFTQARPAGAAAGTNQTARSNILAYDLASGALVTSWAPTLNAQGLTIDASGDGTVIYVGGEFTTVSGVARSRLAALDAATGAVLTGFNANVNSRVRALDVEGDTLYLGGAFSTVGGQPRSRLAAVAASNGALRSWAPTVDAEVFGITAPSSSGKVVAGGRFQFAGGQETRGLAAFSGTDTGSLLPWNSTYGVFPNYGPDSAIYSLSSQGNTVFGTGYDFGGPSPFEASFAIDVNTGSITWVNGCKGDTYSGVAIGDVYYSVGHSHNCAPIGGHPQTDPWTFQRALATTTTPAADGRHNVSGEYTQYAAPELLHWLPTYTAGTFTGQSQAAWSVAGNTEYVVIGGEFPQVNGVAQQGLSRFRVNGPNNTALQGFPELQPRVVSLAPGAARVAWTAAWDRDNRQLTYDVLRGATTNTSTVLATLTADSSWWDRRSLAFTDTTAPPGSSQTYRVRVKDVFNNNLVGTATTATVQSGTAAASPYGDAVRADAPTSYWRLGEASGTTSYDWAGGSDLTVDASAQRGAQGVLAEPNPATTFTGTAAVPATATAATVGPQTFSAEAWFNTTSASGGKIIGFGNSSTGDSSGYDRHIYMTNDGRIVFGVYANAIRTLASSTPFNDGQWHHVVGTLGPDGMALYLDGKRAGRRTDTTSAQAYSGVWRVGGDNLGGWDFQPTSNKFAGSIDEAAVYPAALSAARVQAHYTAAGRTVATAVRPTDTYGSTVYDAQPDSYWRLNETSGGTAADATPNGADGRFFGAPALGVPGVVSTTAVRLDGGDDQVSSAQSVSNPTVYSEELWFNTTTTQGGKLIGFGDQQSGLSGNYDRHVYMFDDGRLRFGVWTGQANVIDTTASYNDGKWHHMAATQGSDGMKLYVDGQLTGSNPQTSAQGYTGYWKVGGDNAWGGNSSSYFAGVVDEVAVYSTALSAAQVTDHFAKGGGQTTPANTPPTAAFTATANGLAVAFDGSSSADDGGTVTGYAWDFGDGATGTGATVNHTYASAGTYTAKLTVTDNGGATGVFSQPVTVTATPPPNAAPTAAFTSSTTGLKASLDASTSTDADGSVTGYAWDFGDRATGTGATVDHTYAAAGTYTVKLTVTDNGGATGTTTDSVTVAAVPPANTPPTASFMVSGTGLNKAFDASAAADADGTIATYAWNFGDGTTGTGRTATHAYTAAKSYDVTLTVTDNGGATGTATQSVVAETPPPTAYATDAFGRTVASGWGTADLGGVWTTSGGTAADYSVNGSVGRITTPNAGSQRAVYLNGVAQTDAEVNLTTSIDKPATGGGQYVQAVGRRVGTAGDYRAKVRFVAGGSIQILLSRTVGSTETTLATSTVAGVTYTPGQLLRVRLQVGGTGPTTLSAKAWLDGTAEPATWLVTTTDSTPALQAAGSVGVIAYASGTTTNNPLVAAIDDFTAGPRRLA